MFGLSHFFANSWVFRIKPPKVKDVLAGEQRSQPREGKKNTKKPSENHRLRRVSRPGPLPAGDLRHLAAAARGGGLPLAGDQLQGQGPDATWGVQMKGFG